MSWKSSPDRKAWTLAARLSAWYAGSAFLLLSVATGFLYWVLLANLEREDDEYLAEKINVVRTLLRDNPENAAVLVWEVEGEAAASPFVRALVRVSRSDGSTVVESRGMAEALPPGAFPAPP